VASTTALVRYRRAVTAVRDEVTAKCKQIEGEPLPDILDIAVE
jgi:hypothetical protein